MTYVPTQIRDPETQRELVQALNKEFEAIGEAFSEMQEVELRPVHREPKKPREGMIVYADGTNWDPGAGKGVYVFTGAAWSKL